MKRILVFIVILSVLLAMSGCKSRNETCNLAETLSMNLHKDFGYGEGIKIAVIDSGVKVSDINSEYALNFSEEDSVIDNIDHGAPIMNILSDEKYGIAPKATIYALKVIDKYGNASTRAVYDALEWCLNNSIDIINMSLSFGIYSENIECIIGQLIDEGVIIVASINNSDKEVDYPAMYDGVICVGKTNMPDIYSEERSILFDDSYVIKAIGINGETNDYVGNSFLTPIVTGIIACLIDKTNVEGSGFNTELVNSAKSLLIQSNVHIS